jgi:hypothetical protein
MLEKGAGENEWERLELLAEQLIEEVAESEALEARDIAENPGDILLEQKHDNLLYRKTPEEILDLIFGGWHTALRRSQVYN